MMRRAFRLVLAVATGALVAGTVLAQPGSSVGRDVQVVEPAAPCYVAPADVDRTTAILIADVPCGAAKAEPKEHEAGAGADHAPRARRVGPLRILP